MGLRLRFRAFGRMEKDPETSIRNILENYRLNMMIYGKVGVRKAAKKLLELSQDLVPVDTGELKKSGKVVKVGESGRKVSYQVVYEALAPWKNSSNGVFNYAWIQHEDMTLKHPNGGQAKYLEEPYRKNKDLLLAILRAETKKGFKR